MTDYQKLATQELINNGNKPGPEGAAARHRARTWAILAHATQPAHPCTCTQKDTP